MRIPKRPIDKKQFCGIIRTKGIFRNKIKQRERLETAMKNAKTTSSAPARKREILTLVLPGKQTQI